MTLYERIRQLRIEAGMSQDDLAHAMGYKDRSMITKIESGKVDISQKKILAFARVLNTTPSFLMGLDSASSALHPSNSEDPISADEAFLLDVYRKLSRAGRDYLMQQLTIASNMFGEKSDTVSKTDIV